MLSYAHVQSFPSVSELLAGGEEKKDEGEEKKPSKAGSSNFIGLGEL